VIGHEKIRLLRLLTRVFGFNTAVAQQGKVVFFQNNFSNGRKHAKNIAADGTRTHI